MNKNAERIYLMFTILVVMIVQDCTLIHRLIAFLLLLYAYSILRWWLNTLK